MWTMPTALDYFADDPQTGAVAMYMESVADGQKVPAGGKGVRGEKTARDLESRQA